MFYKPLSFDGSKVAVLLMNADSATDTLAVTFSDIPGFKVSLVEAQRALCALHLIILRPLSWGSLDGGVF